MRTGAIITGAVLLLPAILGFGTTHAHRQTADRASLVTVEGIVSAVEMLPGEGGVTVTAVRIRLDGPETRELDILLAPESALRQIGFEIETGDRLRARVFLSGDEPAPAHKVLNVSRDQMVRLRTLTRVPLWDTHGQWQGGPCRDRGGPGGSGHRRSGGHR